MKIITKNDLKNEDYLTIGKFEKAIGLDGNIKLGLFSDNDILKIYKKIYVKSNELYRPIKITKVNDANTDSNKIIVRVNDITSKDEVSSYIGKKIYISKSDFEKQKQKELKKDPDAIYIIDVIGSKAIDKESNFEGIVTDIITDAYVPLFKIEYEKEVKDKKDNIQIKKDEILIPYNENCIKDIDTKNKIVYISIKDFKGIIF